MNILRAHDVFLEVLRIYRPGRISYADDHMVAAVGTKRGHARRA